jgi:hypothetical protein
MSHRDASEGLARYRAVIADQPELDDDWFQDLSPALLAREPRAASELAYACMPIAWRLSEDFAAGRDNDVIYACINEANQAVKKAVRSFTGQTYGEFLAHVRQSVLIRLETSGL